MKQFLLFVAATFLLGSCKQKDDFDASGSFEADEVIVAAQQNGQLIAYAVREGLSLEAGDTVGQIDVRLAELQKEQVEASIGALARKTTDPGEQAELVKRQLTVQEAQLSQQLREQARTVKLVKADAATQKQLDDINAVIDQLRKQISVTRQQLRLNTANINTQNRSILSEKEPLEKAAEQFREQIDKGRIINPVSGTVLVNYALRGEVQVMGKPLYKIAALDTLYLRAYVTGTQLPEIKIGQQVNVRIDQGKKKYKNYTGTITWIAGKSEFSPKTIQTKDERANLVYAVKVQVKNDGYLKIGMYGEMVWSKK